MSFRYCAFITERGAGLRAFSGTSPRHPWTSVSAVRTEWTELVQLSLSTVISHATTSSPIQWTRLRLRFCDGLRSSERTTVSSRYIRIPVPAFALQDARIPRRRRASREGARQNSARSSVATCASARIHQQQRPPRQACRAWPRSEVCAAPFEEDEWGESARRPGIKEDQ